MVTIELVFVTRDGGLFESGTRSNNSKEKFVPIKIATMNIRTLKCKCIFLDFLTNALIYLKGLSPDTAIMVRSKTPWYKDIRTSQGT